MSVPDERIIVIGAGIIGIASAVHLRRRGFSVNVIDRLGPGEGTSFGNSGLLSPRSVVPVPVPRLLATAPRMIVSRDSPLFLRWRYVPRLLPWLVPYLRNAAPSRVRRIAAALAPLISDTVEEHESLARGTPAERWLRRSGLLTIFRARRDYERESFSWELRREYGLEADELDAGALQELVPGLSPDYGFGLRLAGYGMVSSPSRYVKDLAGHFESIGGKIVRAEVTGVQAPADGPVVVTADGVTHAADRLVVAAGAFSRRIANMIGDDFPLEAERGYHVELRDPSVVPPLPVMVADARMVATPMAGDLRFSGLVEFGGLDAGPAAAPIRFLLGRARKVFPGITYAGHSEWMGHRPATTDSLPVIGARYERPSVLYAFGHHHVGLTGGPKTGRLVAQLIAGDRPNLDLAPYSADRKRW